MDFANTAVRDDTIVREGGCGPGYVHLRDTNYPSCRRVTMGACYKTLPNPVGQAVLAGYSQNYCPSGLTSMRHMPPFIAKIGESLWRAAYHRLPKQKLDTLPFQRGAPGRKQTKSRLRLFER